MMSTEDQDLVDYFAGLVLPKSPLRLSAHELIYDLPGFIASQLTHLRTGISAPTARAKLRMLQERLVAQQNNQLPQSGGDCQ
ncbi:hypothetical protein WBJ53_17780 [Spirosoma sp. SC4-14]|uniref:DUF6965 family protein n=1 Tax=Spirosoma sp. SC4-14 TaxID=3128900 RepID=UPI0030D5267A